MDGGPRTRTGRHSTVRIHAAVATVLLISTSVLATGDPPALPEASLPRGACRETTRETASAADSVAAAREALREAEAALGGAGAEAVEQAVATGSEGPAVAAAAVDAAREAARAAIDALLADDAPDALTAALLAEAEARLALAGAALESASRLPAEAATHASATAAEAVASASGTLAAAQAALEQGPGPVTPETVGERLEGAAADADAAVADEDAAARALAWQLLVAPPFTVWTSLNDGDGSCLDADTLDGFEARDFLDLVDAEAAARVRGDASLASALGAEETARAAGDASLAAAVAAEAAARRAADASLDARARALESAQQVGAATRVPALGVGIDPRATGVTLAAETDLVISTGERPTITRVSHTCVSSGGLLGGGATNYRVTAIRADGTETHPSLEYPYSSICGAWGLWPYAVHVIQWTPVPGAVGYRVYKSGTPNVEGVALANAYSAGTTLYEYGTTFSGPLRVPPRTLLGARISDDVSHVGPKLGVGTSTPREELEVVGDAEVRGFVRASAVNATRGVVASKQGDGGHHVAITAWTTSATPLASGRVVEISDVRWGDALFVDLTTTNMSRKVVGVLTWSPAVQLGIPNARASVAIAGVVQVMATGNVTAGDLLVSSHVPGVAKACPSGASCAGAAFAKALTPRFGSGSGLIYALLGPA